jgi:hypothetical protein
MPKTRTQRYNDDDSDDEIRRVPRKNQSKRDDDNDNQPLSVDKARLKIRSYLSKRTK